MRILLVVIVNRWKIVVFVFYLGNEWFIINVDAVGNVTSLNCFVCKYFVDKVKGMKNFSSVWVFTGSINFRLSNVEDYVRGDFYKRAMDFYLVEDKG